MSKVDLISIDFAAERIAAITDARHLRALSTRVKHRIADCEVIGWPALAASWTRTFEQIEDRITELEGETA